LASLQELSSGLPDAIGVDGDSTKQQWEVLRRGMEARVAAMEREVQEHEQYKAALQACTQSLSEFNNIVEDLKKKSNCDVDIDEKLIALEVRHFCRLALFVVCYFHLREFKVHNRCPMTYYKLEKFKSVICCYSLTLIRGYETTRLEYNLKFL